MKEIGPNEFSRNYTKLAMLTFLYCLILKNMTDRETHHINKIQSTMASVNLLSNLLGS